MSTLVKLHTNIKNCQKGRLRTGIVLLHDNTKPHMVGLTMSILMTLKVEVFTHSVYSPVLSLSDYEVFGSLKKFLEGKCFSTNEEVKNVVKEQRVEFWRDVMYKLSECWQTCIDGMVILQNIINKALLSSETILNFVGCFILDIQQGEPYLLIRLCTSQHSSHS